MYAHLLTNCRLTSATVWNLERTNGLTILICSHCGTIRWPLSNCHSSNSNDVYIIWMEWPNYDLCFIHIWCQLQHYLILHPSHIDSVLLDVSMVTVFCWWIPTHQDVSGVERNSNDIIGRITWRYWLMNKF